MSRRSIRRLSTILVRLGVVGAIVGAAVAGSVVGASAQTGPQVRIDRPEVAPGEPILVTFEGFDASFVDIVLCGNLAYRGAADCAVTAGVSKETRAGRPKVVQMVAHAPPTHCPCVIKATSPSGEELAVAPITLVGHPVDDVVGVPDAPLVEVSVEVAEANEGLVASLRSALGGPTRYVGTVSVRNTTAEPLDALDVSGSVGHWLDDDAVELEIESPGVLAPGQTWTSAIVAEVSAPSVGDYRFEIIAAGAGATVTATTVMTHQPLLLWVLAVVLAVDVLSAVFRWVVKRSAERSVMEDRLLDHDEWDDWDGSEREPEVPALV